MDVHVKQLFANVGEIANLLEILHIIAEREARLMIV